MGLAGDESENFMNIVETTKRSWWRASLKLDVSLEAFWSPFPPLFKYRVLQPLIHPPFAPTLPHFPTIRAA
jgi:hypothetical protein